MKRPALRVLLACSLACSLVCSLVGAASGQLTPEAVVTSPAAAPDDGLGASVALDGDTLALGARMRAPLTSSGPGRVEVYRGAGPGWALEATLSPPAGSPADEFGAAVALDGDTLVVGAPYADHLAPTGGAAYVYVRQGHTWSLQQELLPTGIGPGHTLGSAVAVEGDRLLIGAAGGVGQAFVFERTGAVWTQTQRLQPAGLTSPDQFGSAVDLDGDRLVVTAPVHGGGGHHAGAAFVFEHQAGQWSEVQRLFGTPDMLIGMAVALDGDFLVATNFPASPSQVFVWSRSSGAWVPEPPLQASAGARWRAVDLEGQRLVVGGWPDRSSLFERQGGQWVETLQLRETAGVTALGGQWIALDGDQVAVGARDRGATSTGGAFIFHLSGREVTAFCDALPNSTGAAASLGLEGSLSVAANDARLHVLGGPPSSVALMTYGASASGVPFANGLLCIDPLQGVHRVTTTGLDGAGRGTIPLDLSGLSGPGAISAGESWVFQAWYRDPAAGGANFNLTNALRVRFTQ